MCPTPNSPTVEQKIAVTSEAPSCLGWEDGCLTLQAMPENNFESNPAAEHILQAPDNRKEDETPQVNPFMASRHQRESNAPEVKKISV